MVRRENGINTAIIPKENQEQLDRLIEQGKLIEDENFKVGMVETVFEAVCYFMGWCVTIHLIHY